MCHSLRAKRLRNVIVRVWDGSTLDPLCGRVQMGLLCCFGVALVRPRACVCSCVRVCLCVCACLCVCVCVCTNSMHILCRYGVTKSAMAFVVTIA